MDRTDVIARIDALPEFYAVSSTGLLLLRDPGNRQALRGAGFDHVSLPRPDGSSVSIALEPAFSRADTDDEEFNLPYLRSLFGMMLADVVSDLQALGYSLAAGEPDEFNVLRILRNASAHGNKFDIRNPNAPTFTFRELTIDPTMNGQGPVLFDFATPSLIFDLFGAVKGLV